MRDRWARLRFAIIGPLLAAPPAAGELMAVFRQLAAKRWQHPVSDREISFSIGTLQRWFYRARAARDPVSALANRLRTDLGRFPSLSPQAIEILTAQYREHPGWTLQLHVDNLRVALWPLQLPVPSYPTVRRYFIAHGLKRQAMPKARTAGALHARERLEQREVRSFEVDHVGALWHLDFHHGSRKVIRRSGESVKPLLLGVIDDHSRLVCHLQWYLEETAECLIHGLSQAFMKRGLPRALMTDNGAAMLAEETTNGLATLGIVHQTTLPYSPYQNAKQESFWGRIEGRLMAMLEGENALTLERLNQATQAWVEQEYHRTVHREIGTTPLARFLAGSNVSRECPPAAQLARAFQTEVVRQQRRSDGTFSLQGRRFEIPLAYRHLTKVHVRYARWDLSHMDLVDARSGVVLSPLYPLDKSANADGQRRQKPVRATEPMPPSTGMAPLLRQLLAEYAATGLPPAYLPTLDKDPQ